MQIKTLMSEIEKIYYNHFPDSKIFVKHYTNLGNCVGVTCVLAGNQKECHNEIWENDLFHISFFIQGENGREFPKDTTLESDISTFVLENNRKSYTTKPTNQYCVYGHHSLSFRKSSGDGDKIIQSFDKFIVQLKKSLIDDLKNDNISKDFMKIVAQKLGV